MTQIRNVYWLLYRFKPLIWIWPGLREKSWQQPASGLKLCACHPISRGSCGIYTVSMLPRSPLHLIGLTFMTIPDVLSTSLLCLAVWVIWKAIKLIFVSKSDLDNIPGPPSDSYLKGDRWPLSWFVVCRLTRVRPFPSSLRAQCLGFSQRSVGKVYVTDISIVTFLTSFH